MPPLMLLDGPAARRWFEHALRTLLLVRREVDELNVFPVPDADTGTNLVRTLAAAARATTDLPAETELHELLRVAADGALVGARGSSGIILSQAMQGMAEAADNHTALDGRLLADVLRTAASHARAAVSRPVEGTILTVAQAAGDGAAQAEAAGDGAGRAEAAGDGADRVGAAPLEAVAAAALAAARSALADTRGAHGGRSVDAGAAGFVTILTALVDVVAGTEAIGTGRAVGIRGVLTEDVTRPPTGAAARADGSPPDEMADVGAEHPAKSAEHGAGAFEVMYVLEADADRADHLRAELGRTGHAVAVVGQSRAGAGQSRTGIGGRPAGLWHVHVHTDTPATALAEPARMRQVCVRALTGPGITDGVGGASRTADISRTGDADCTDDVDGTGHADRTGHTDRTGDADRPDGDVRAGTVGVVACTRAPGLLAVLARTGAVVVLDAEREGIERAVSDVDADEVIVLPCERAAARAAQEVADRPPAAPHRPAPRVHVAPTTDELQVLAAAAELATVATSTDGQADVAVASLRAVERVVAGLTTREVRSGPDGTVGPAEVGAAAGDLLGSGVELVTVLVGAGVDAAALAGVRRSFARSAPGAELVVVDGGQPAPPLLVGVE